MWKKYEYKTSARYIQKCIYNELTKEVYITEYGENYDESLYTVIRTNFFHWKDSKYWHISDLTDEEVDLMKLELL